jgi:hypothetical protein
MSDVFGNGWKDVSVRDGRDLSAYVPRRNATTSARRPLRKNQQSGNDLKKKN